MYRAITWSEIRQRLRERYDQKPFWTPTEALLAFNEGLSVWNLATGRWRTRETIPTTLGTYLYSVSTALLQHTRVTFNGLPMTSSNREDFNQGRYQWRSDTTLTGRPVPDRPMLWAPISLRSFYIWPADGEAVNNGLVIDGVAATPVLVEDADFLDLGDEELNVLLGYALHVLTLTKGGSFFSDTLPLFKAFLAAAAETNGQIKASQVFRRYMGLDDRGMQPLRGVATAMDALAGSA